VGEAKPSRPLHIVRKRDALDTLREAVGELEHFATAWQAAGICAPALARAVEAAAVLVHLHDHEQQELRTNAVYPMKAPDLLGAIEKTEDDVVMLALVANGKPVTVRFDGALPRFAPERLRIVGAKHSLVAAPAMSSGACVAVVEVIDAPLPVADRVVDASRFVANQLAAFIAHRKK
jgi:hypothetical protein